MRDDRSTDEPRATRVPPGLHEIEVRCGTLDEVSGPAVWLFIGPLGASMGAARARSLAGRLTAAADQIDPPTS